MNLQVVYLMMLQLVQGACVVILNQQRALIVCILCCVHAWSSRKPRMYVLARSTAWTETVLRPDLYEETRFRFFFGVTRSRYESNMQGIGP